MIDTENLESAVGEVSSVEPLNGSELAFRGENERWVPKLSRPLQWPMYDEERGYELLFGERGALANLKFVPLEFRRASDESRVVVQVEASDLTFRDVLNVLDMYPGDPGNIGAELAERIIGTKERVIGFAQHGGAFASHVETSRDIIATSFDGLSSEAGAGISIVFCTAVLKAARDFVKGKTVFIHSAAGGVGVAAVQLARANFGALHVFGTANSAKKQTFAKMWGLDSVLQSRDTSYTEMCLYKTGGQGTSYILYSLTGGDFVERSMCCLCEHGFWAKIGKRGIMTKEQFEQARPKGTYMIYDW